VLRLCGGLTVGRRSRLRSGNRLGLGSGIVEGGSCRGGDRASRTLMVVFGLQVQFTMRVRGAAISGPAWIGIDFTPRPLWVFVSRVVKAEGPGQRARSLVVCGRFVTSLVWCCEGPGLAPDCPPSVVVLVCARLEGHFFPPRISTYRSVRTSPALALQGWTRLTLWVRELDSARVAMSESSSRRPGRIQIAEARVASRSGAGKMAAVGRRTGVVSSLRAIRREAGVCGVGFDRCRQVAAGGLSRPRRRMGRLRPAVRMHRLRSRRA
jgi:hypothetical protein